MEPGHVASIGVSERLGMAYQGQTTAFYGGETIEHYLWTPATSS